MSEDIGASANADRATHEPSQQAVSAVPVSVPSAALQMAISALSLSEREALSDLWALSRKTVHRLALMGFVKEWHHYMGCAGYSLVRTKRGDELAEAIEARRAETQGGSVHESAVAEGHAPGDGS